MVSANLDTDIMIPMNRAHQTYASGQVMRSQTGTVLTYYFNDGMIKAQGDYIDGRMQGRWIFNKKSGFLWQVGYFDEDGKQHSDWIVYKPDGTIQDHKYFVHGKRSCRQRT